MLRHPQIESPVTRLTLTLGTLFAVLILLAAYGYQSLHDAFGATESISEQISRQTNATLQLQRTLQRAAIPIHHYHFEGRAEEREHFMHLSHELNRLMTEALALRSHKEHELLLKAQEAWLEAESMGAALLAIPDLSLVPLEHVHHEIHTLDTRIKEASAFIDELHEGDRNKVAERIAQVAQENRQLVGIVIGSFVLALVAIGFGGLAVVRSQAILKELSLRDALTGLYNRRAFYLQLNHYLNQARRTRQPCSLLLLDIDHFKKINDSYGHQIGDEVLRAVADVVGEVVRRQDVVARYGGEELVVILPDADEETALLIGNRLRLAIASSQRVSLPDGTPLMATVSVGMAMFPLDGTLEDGLLNAADQAMYVAKQSGRNQVQRCGQQQPLGVQL